MAADRDFETVLAHRRATEAWETMTREPRCTLYAVYDGAREPIEMYRALVASGLPQSCLFGDAVLSPLLEAAPWCVHLSANPGVGRELLLAFWSKQAGIFVSADAGTELRAMRKHLKRLLQVKLPTGEKVLFRFYDPRVLRVFAPTCDEEQTQQMLGQNQSLWCESEDGDSILQYDAGDFVHPIEHRLASDMAPIVSIQSQK